jgi:hypothetical protein
MKRKQVSIRGEIYAEVKAHCAEKGMSVSEFVDRLCRAHFEKEPGAKSKLQKPSNHRGLRF